MQKQEKHLQKNRSKDSKVNEKDQIEKNIRYIFTKKTKRKNIENNIEKSK